MITDNKQAEAAIRSLLTEYAKQDRDFARDLNRPDKSIREFMMLLMKKMMKDGAKGQCAVYGDDKVLIGQAIHYFHEDKVTEDDLSTDDIYLYKVSTTDKKADTKPSPKAKPSAKPKAKKPAPQPVDDIDIDLDELPDIDIDLD